MPTNTIVAIVDYEKTDVGLDLILLLPLKVAPTPVFVLNRTSQIPCVGLGYT